MNKIVGIGNKIAVGSNNKMLTLIGDNISIGTYIGEGLTSSVTTDNYILNTVNNVILTYQDYQQITLTFHTTNQTTTPSININNIGFEPLVNSEGLSLNIGEIGASCIIYRFNSHWRILNGIGGNNGSNSNITAPVLVSTSTDYTGNIITLYYNSLLSGTPDFTVYVNLNEVIISSQVILGQNVIIYPLNKLLYSDTIKISSSNPNTVYDVTGAKSASVINNIPITNNVIPPPILQNVTTNSIGSVIILNYNSTLAGIANGFYYSINGSSNINLSNGIITDNYVTFTVTTNFVYGQNVLISSPNPNNIMDSSETVNVLSFSNVSVDLTNLPNPANAPTAIISPTNGAINISTAINILVTFTSPDNSTLKDGNNINLSNSTDWTTIFTLSDTSNNNISCTFTYNNTLHKLTVNPNIFLLYNTSYNYSIGNVKNASGTITTINGSFTTTELILKFNVNTYTLNNDNSITPSLIVNSINPNTQNPWFVGKAGQGPRMNRSSISVKRNKIFCISDFYYYIIVYDITTDTVENYNLNFSANYGYGGPGGAGQGLDSCYYDDTNDILFLHDYFSHNYFICDVTYNVNGTVNTCISRTNNGSNYLSNYDDGIPIGTQFTDIQGSFNKSFLFTYNGINYLSYTTNSGNCYLFTISNILTANQTSDFIYYKSLDINNINNLMGLFIDEKLKHLSINNLRFDLNNNFNKLNDYNLLNLLTPNISYIKIYNVMLLFNIDNSNNPLIGYTSEKVPQKLSFITNDNNNLLFKFNSNLLSYRSIELYNDFIYFYGDSGITKLQIN